MARYEQRTFRDQTVDLDGNEYVSCIFINCELIFRAASPVVINRAQFNECRWAFEGAAALTVDFMTGIYQAGATTLIEQTFETIRRGGRRPEGWNPEA